MFAGRLGPRLICNLGAWWAGSCTAFVIKAGASLEEPELPLRLLCIHNPYTPCFIVPEGEAAAGLIAVKRMRSPFVMVLPSSTVPGKELRVLPVNLT